MPPVPCFLPPPCLAMANPRDSHSDSSTFVDDDRELAALGYKPSFKREFSNLATVRL